MSVRLAVAAMVCCMALPAAAQGIFDLPDLAAEPENSLCPEAPARPEWAVRPKPGTQLSQAGLGNELYRLQGYRNVVEAGRCTCDLRFPSWDEITRIIETEFATVTRMEFHAAMPDIRKATKAYRLEAREICRAADLW